MVKNLVLAALLLPGAAAVNIVAAQMEHMAKPSAGFSQLTPLAGEWDATEGDKAVHASYEVVSAGTALLERLRIAGEQEMVTIYTPDGDRLAATHFCPSGNQPQMSTAPVGAGTKTFSFSFIRATNLPTPATGHMHHLTVTLDDPTHFTQKWTWLENGASHTLVLHFTRKA